MYRINASKCICASFPNCPFSILFLKYKLFWERDVWHSCIWVFRVILKESCEFCFIRSTKNIFNGLVLMKINRLLFLKVDWKYNYAWISSTHREFKYTKGCFWGSNTSAILEFFYLVPLCRLFSFICAHHSSVHTFIKIFVEVFGSSWRCANFDINVRVIT